MKLRTFNRHSMPSNKTKLPSISYQRVGSWFLNQDLCELMGLEPDDGLCVHQDEKNPLDWYLSKGKDGIPLRRPTAKARGLIMNAKSLVDQFRTAWEDEHREEAAPSARMHVSLTPVAHALGDLFPIITGSLTSQGRGRRKGS